MPISLLDPRTVTLISRLVGRGWSANRIWGSLPGYGFPKFHRQTFLGSVRRITGLAKKETAARAADPYERFPKGSMVEEPLMEDVRYRTYFDVQLKDRRTGELFDVQTKSMYHDEWASPDEWESDYIGKYRDYWGKKDVELVNIKLKSVEHFRGRPY